MEVNTIVASLVDLLIIYARTFVAKLGVMLIVASFVFIGVTFISTLPVLGTSFNMALATFNTSAPLFGATVGVLYGAWFGARH